MDAMHVVNKECYDKCIYTVFTFFFCGKHSHKTQVLSSGLYSVEYHSYSPKIDSYPTFNHFGELALALKCRNFTLHNSNVIHNLAWYEKIIKKGKKKKKIRQKH